MGFMNIWNLQLKNQQKIPRENVHLKASKANKWEMS